MLHLDPIEYIEQADPRFPALLRQISRPPDGLFVRGALDDHQPCISIVGTRKNTSYGKRVVDLLVPELARAGFAIISGMALGIDGLVHRAALDAGGKTIAVLGTGIDDDSLYPRAHTNLAYEIMDSGGAVVSEFVAGTPSRKEHFPIRNRIIAGWSLATIVIEGSPDSGSLITAKLALDFDREVLAVPGSIWSDTSRGCHVLIKAGARLCESPQDVFDAIQLDRPAQISETRKLLPLTPDESRLLQTITRPLHVDELVLESGLDSAKIGAALSILELKGYASHLGGQIWARTSGLPK